MRILYVYTHQRNTPTNTYTIIFKKWGRRFHRIIFFIPHNAWRPIFNSLAKYPFDIVI